jgi:hypothetical protein
MSARTTLSPLRTARAEQAASLIADHTHGMALIEETYRGARNFNGLTRGQIDQALDDLVAADRVELVNSAGVVIARLVREAAE